MNSKTRKALIAKGYKVFGSLVKVAGDLFPLPLVEGNEKLGKKVWHGSTLPTNKEFHVVVKDKKTGEVIKETTETGACPMSCKGCYGTAGNYNFPSVQYSLAMRTKLLRQFPEIYFDLVRIQLENEGIEKLRIHATGDFLPGEALAYYNILKDFPHIKAWTYTKVENDHDIELLNSLPNCNVVKSIIPGCGFNYGHVAYIANMFYRLKRLGKSVYICRCGIDENQHCSSCDGCSDHEYVLFIEHSTGYNARADYGYNKVVELIENQ